MLPVMSKVEQVEYHVLNHGVKECRATILVDIRQLCVRMIIKTADASAPASPSASKNDFIIGHTCCTFIFNKVE